ncbi:hypothetical protein U1E44_07055 [Arenibacter sp. GZD96]|uniref:hypothetical protein n=1 Tax=Aurantibrevibacter litoralis TaxID=3106030 RepID=UPI002AFE5742|nr:hypothetical protein [Arenibacter sp. GZD-96]MEA1785843.1 hypothetical protein [Arenibacter sp. GZD-96]
MEIVVARHNEALVILNGSDQSFKSHIAYQISQNLNTFNPLVLYAFSCELF